MFKPILLAIALVVPSLAFASGTGTARTCLFEGSPEVVRIYMGAQGDAVAVLSDSEIELEAQVHAKQTVFLNTEGIVTAMLDNETTWAIGWFGGDLAEGVCEFGATE